MARDRDRLLTNYTQLNLANTVGNYRGSLANAGERIALAMPYPEILTNALGQFKTNWIYALVNEVSWRQGGRWPELANGGGSSLELVDPRADNRWAGNWAASDETAKSEWTTVEATGVLDNGNGGYPPNQLQLFLLGSGECLVDNVEAVRAGGANTIPNPLLHEWTDRLGSSRGTNPLPPGSPGRASTTAPVFTSARGGERRHGREPRSDPRFRVVGRQHRHLARPGPLVERLAGDPAATPRGTGWRPREPSRSRATWAPPGLPNSRWAPNAGPAIAEVTHDPALPAAGQAVTVRARVDDPDGLASLVLFYRLDPATNYTRPSA